jgi:hypothetical protein
MPSPVGHALGGVIVGLLSGIRQRERVVLALLVIAANGPDADFLWGRHGAETHSIGAAIVAGLVTMVLSRGNRRLAIAVSLAWMSHVFFDWLGSDDTPPIGIMALWPFSNAYYFANAYIFESISRRYWLSNFWTHNLYAVVKEVAILGPVAAMLWWWNRRGESSDPPAHGRRV